MLIGIVIVSVITLAVVIFGIVSLVNTVLNFKSNKEKRNRSIIRFAISVAIILILGGLNTFLIIKYVYDNRKTIERAASTVIDIAADYTGWGSGATTSTFTKFHNANVKKQFEDLDISYSSSKIETADDTKIYEIELVLDNRIRRKKELYIGGLVQENYLLACDNDDFVYKIIPEDADFGTTKNQSLTAMIESLDGREYAKFGKILPGKTRHKILVLVPKDIEIGYLQFLDRRININNN